MSLLGDLKRLQKVLQAVNDRYNSLTLPSDDTVTLTWAASKGNPIDTERQRLLDHLDKMLGESPSTRRH